MLLTVLMNMKVLKKDSSSSEDSDDIAENIIDAFSPPISEKEVQQAFGDIIDNTNLSPKGKGTKNRRNKPSKKDSSNVTTIVTRSQAKTIS